MIWATVSIFSLIFLAGSISTAKHPNIISGNTATIKHFPYIVSIRESGGVVHLCGGSIISIRHVLTAAHCVSYTNIDELTIHTGTSRSDRVGNVHKILSAHVHPTYESRDEVDGSDDIAVLKLKEPIVFNKYQQQINLPSDDIQNHQVAYVVGWGRLSTSSWEMAPQLQKLRVALLPSEKCQPFLTDTKIDKKQFCAFRNMQKSVCHGDSGGPLVSHGKIVGIVSRGDTGHCADGIPDIYTNVFAHKDFIKSVMNE